MKVPMIKYEFGIYHQLQQVFCHDHQRPKLLSTKHRLSSSLAQSIGIPAVFAFFLFLFYFNVCNTSDFDLFFGYVEMYTKYRHSERFHFLNSRVSKCIENIGIPSDFTLSLYSVPMYETNSLLFSSLCSNI
jgi:hypothetical protein